jgi:hypothetical protein
MIDAELNGKVPEVQNREDILTSNYFSLIKYCTMRTFSHTFLSAARSLKGEQFNIPCIPDKGWYPFTSQKIWYIEVNKYI